MRESRAATATVTILVEGSEVQLHASTDGGVVGVSAEGVERALGWELTDEGFCLEPVCYPLPPDADLVINERVDLAGLAAHASRRCLARYHHSLAATQPRTQRFVRPNRFGELSLDGDRTSRNYLAKAAGRCHLNHCRARIAVD